jgi:formate dehydrogenase gamma subunit
MRTQWLTLWLLLAALWPAAAGAAPQSEECLACHGEQGARSESGRSLYVDAAKQKASVHGALGCRDCHASIQEFPHPKRPARVDCGTCHAEEAEATPKSVHGALGKQACTSCHGEPHEIRAPGKTPGQECKTCHADVVQEFRRSIHGAPRDGGKSLATCASCHGSPHGIVLRSDPASPVAKKNLPHTCASCHSNPQILAKYNIPFALPVEAYRLSVHGRAVARGNEAAASCSDCHSSHAILPARDPQARINHWNVPQTCGTCHTEIAKTYWESVHGQAVRNGATDAPVCTDCHGEHRILAPNEPQSLVNPARVSAVTCGRCHSDERLTERYHLPPDRVPTFQDSYHGLALRAGSQTVANCASCHGVHNILPASDPRSTVYPGNLSRTCGSCHPGAGQAFAIGPVHVRAATVTEHPVVKGIRWIYWVLIPLTLGFMLLHNGIDFFRKLVRGPAVPRSGETVARMNLHFRVAHWLVMLSFPVLVVTGFALKFPEAWWARPILLWENRFAFRGTLHRIAAVVLVGALIYHTAHLIRSRRDRAILAHLIPGREDLRDLVGLIRYNLGMDPDRPRFGKFNYAEKAEYWAFVWGSLLMTLSGFLLWFNNFTLRHFPKWVADAATAIHYYEAILATFSILIWHFYVTIFDPDVYPMDLSWLTGRTSADHFGHTRPAYYKQLVESQPADPPAEKKPPQRKRKGPSTPTEKPPL